MDVLNCILLYTITTLILHCRLLFFFGVALEILYNHFLFILLCTDTANVISGINWILSLYLRHLWGIICLSSHLFWCWWFLEQFTKISVTLRSHVVRPRWEPSLKYDRSNFWIDFQCVFYLVLNVERDWIEVGKELLFSEHCGVLKCYGDEATVNESVIRGVTVPYLPKCFNRKQGTVPEKTATRLCFQNTRVWYNQYVLFTCFQYDLVSVFITVWAPPSHMAVCGSVVKRAARARLTLPV